MTNKALVEHFYSCFQQKDYKGMQDCYADNATFSDSVFVNLNAAEVRAMWQMLCLRGKDLVLEYNDVTENATGGTAEWVAHYTFSATKRKVTNRIKAKFVIENGKIVSHIDDFDFYRWSSQALGLVGKLLGWTGFFKNKVRQNAANELDKFMLRENLR